MSVVKSVEVSFTETDGAGTYTGSVAIPAGATIVDIVVHGVALWTATTSATLIVGDGADNDRYYTGVNLKATDLLAGETLRFAAPGGKQGVDLADLSGAGAQMKNLYSASARTVSAVVTTVGAAGNAGRTRVTVFFTTTGSGVVAAATKA